MKNVDLDEPTSFLDHVSLGCTQRECKPNEIISEEYTKMFESHISAGATEKLPGWENSSQRPLPGPTTWKDMLKMCWEILRVSKPKSGQQLYIVSSPCLDDHQLKREEHESVGELSKVCSLEMLVVGTNWRTRHSVVCDKTCKSSHKMESGLRQTFDNIEFIRSSHKSLQRILSCT